MTEGEFVPDLGVRLCGRWLDVWRSPGGRVAMLAVPLSGDLGCHPDSSPAMSPVTYDSTIRLVAAVPAATSFTGGPGAELKRLLAELGLEVSPECNCTAYAAQMDAWGVAGCRDHEAEIAGWLWQAAKARGLAAFLTATARAIGTGLAFKLNPFYPVTGLVREAIRCAEAATDSVVLPSVTSPVSPAFSSVSLSLAKPIVAPLVLPRALLVIGHFGIPGAVEYQLSLARKNLRGVPVLVSDDHTEQAWDASKGETPADGAARLAHLEAVCERYGATLVKSHPADRLRHAGGDLAAMYNGLVHARVRGIPYVWKLSMRLFIDLPGWLPAAIADWERCVADTGEFLPASAHECYHTGLPPGQVDLRFPVRTECIGFRVKDWAADAYLHPTDGLLAPRNLSGVATETVIGNAMMASGGGLFGPRFITAYRQQKLPGVWWHDSHPGEIGAAEARAAAAKLGIDLGPEFHADGARMTPGWAGD